jgi:hypothetical protein
MSINLHVVRCLNKGKFRVVGMGVFKYCERISLLIMRITSLESLLLNLEKVE